MISPKPVLDDLRIERGAAPARPAMPWPAVVFGLVLLLAGGAIWWRASSAVVEVRTAVARDATSRGGERVVLNASGYVTARRQATVSAKVTGKVIEILIEEGMKVQAGQVLARLDDTNVKTSLDLAGAQLESARVALDETRAQLKQADLEFQRATELARQKIASQSDLDKAEADAKVLSARLARQLRDVTVAERQVSVWQQQLEDMVIRAPFSGIVTTKDAQPGEMISPVSAGGGFTRTGICTIVDMNSLEIEIDVNESYIHRVQAGQPVEATLDAYPEWKIPCKVIAIIPTADRQKATVKVRVGIDGLEARILPEMAAKVAFRETGGAASSGSTVAVPKSALQQQDGRDVVLVLQRDRVERRAVTVSGAQNEEVLLSAGLTPGEKVVLDPPHGLKDGLSVKEKLP